MIQNDSTLNIQKHSTLKIKQGFHNAKVLFNPFHATNLFLTQESMRKTKVWRVQKKTVGINYVNWEIFTLLLIFGWKNSYNESLKGSGRII